MGLFHLLKHGKWVRIGRFCATCSEVLPTQSSAQALLTHTCERANVPCNVVAPANSLNPVNSASIYPHQIPWSLNKSINWDIGFIQIFQVWPPRSHEEIHIVPEIRGKIKSSAFPSGMLVADTSIKLPVKNDHHHECVQWPTNSAQKESVICKIPDHNSTFHILQYIRTPSHPSAHVKSVYRLQLSSIFL